MVSGAFWSAVRLSLANEIVTGQWRSYLSWKYIRFGKCPIFLSMRIFCMTFLFLLELFTWAELPWNGFADAEIIPKIQLRDKLPHPGPICPDAVYQAMLACWKLGICDNPRFSFH